MKDDILDVLAGIAALLLVGAAVVGALVLIPATISFAFDMIHYGWNLGTSAWHWVGGLF